MTTSDIVQTWQQQSACDCRPVLRAVSVTAYVVQNSATTTIGGSTANALSIQPYSLTLEIASGDVNDLSGRFTYPRVGYEWPITDQQLSLFPTNNRIWLTYNNNSTDVITFYFKVLWRFNNFTDPARDQTSSIVAFHNRLHPKLANPEEYPSQDDHADVRLPLAGEDTLNCVPSMDAWTLQMPTCTAL